MKIALIGATGRVGGFVLKDSLEKSHNIKVLCRKASKLSDYVSRIEIVEGDATIVDDVKKLIADYEIAVIISTIGSPSKTSLMVEAAAKALVQARYKQVQALSSKKPTIPRVVWMTSTEINEATE